MNMLHGGGATKKRSVRWFMLVGIAVMVWMLAGCSSSNSDQNAKSDGYAGSATSDNAAASTEAAAPMADGDTEMTTSSSNSSANTAESAEEPPAAGMSDTGSNIPDGESSFTRKIIYKANVNMEVEDYGKAQTSLRNLIHLSGGYLLSFSDKKTTSELGGTYTIKVPAAGFDTFISELEKIKHEGFESSAQGTDVTEEYVDMEARLKARQVVEARLTAFMEKATKTTDLLQISNQLGEVQTEIERIKGRIRYLDKNVEYSTIDLRMYQLLEPLKAKDEEEQGFLARITDAMSGSTNVVYAFIQGVFIFIAGALPVLALAAIVGIPSYLAYRSNRRKRHSHQAAGTLKVPATETAEPNKEESDV
ncbi:DUF4349 domain-containing protein [Paenibacillus sp. CF384]|uniref:DUF4349 domain-containing protein n=1 Tax=Paenibacillus sp. CF384 TaxID=1884382 RepID=UPI00089BFD30|nr:DUF4349 domain-containing protein [Paenibacillus sp. CF384]SDW87231.1 protein of unknown function [Paenibacillus sp. CF384]